MAQRRMIDKRTIQTQKFLRLPLETQALYFHLMLNADDDGVVEAFPIVRMVGAAEDNLGLLVIKQFIKPLNEEMVYFILDFKAQNTVRKDMYKPSIYADLIDNVTEPSQVRDVSVDVDKNRLDKNRLDKNRLDKNNILSSNLDDVKEILSYLNEKAGTSYRASSKKTQALVKARFAEGYNLNDFKKVIDNKVVSWKSTEWEKYLRPETLFSPKFEGYLNEKPRINSKKTFETGYDEDLGF